VVNTLVAEEHGRTQIVVNGLKEIAGYDLRKRQEIMALNGGGDIPVASPVLAARW